MESKNIDHAVNKVVKRMRPVFFIRLNATTNVICITDKKNRYGR